MFVVKTSCNKTQTHSPAQIVVILCRSYLVPTTCLTCVSVFVCCIFFKLFLPWARVADERHGTLRLSNLTKSMSGKYICRASNTAGSDSCSINLEVLTCTFTNSTGILLPTIHLGLNAARVVCLNSFECRRDRRSDSGIGGGTGGHGAPPHIHP